ncbi:MAG: phenylacetate--CoA ligase [Saprospiraceae bacterium]|nr:phenylacetate--CoA ligase [Saprospiraceae bacterium]
MFNPELETLPRKRLRKLQDERLVRLVHYLYERVEFYRKQLDRLNIRPDDISGIDDMHRLPITRKSDLRDHYPFGMFAVSKNELRRIHASSGTTGQPTVVGYTARDLDVFAEVNARSLKAAGAQPGMKLHNAYGYGLFTGGLGLHAGAEKLGMAVIPVSGGMTDRQIRLLQDFAPEVICCTPSYAQTLAYEMERRSIDPDHLALRYAVLGAEPWTETIRQQVEEGLGVMATNIYGLSEIIGPGVSQEDVDERGRGSHIWEDHFYPEVLDPETGEPLPEGEEGVLVMTTLTKEALPLLRYWTNDICSLYYDPESKRSHIKMSPIKGRADDMLIIRGVNLFPTQIEELISEIDELQPYYQLVVSRQGTLDEVVLRVEVDKKFLRVLGLENLENPPPATKDKLLALRSRLIGKIKDNIGLKVKVELKKYGELIRSEGGKLNRVLDLRNL